MGSELEVIIKLVDEVVKPLLSIKSALENTQGDFSKVQGELSTLTYQLIALYDCLEKESKCITRRSADLEELGKRFNKGLQSLETIPQKIDQSVQAGIREAANDLKQAVQEQVRVGLKAEVDPAVESLQQAVNQSIENLNSFDAMTWMMHIKILIIAIVCGLVMGVGSFFMLSRKMDGVRCECLCVLKPEEVVIEKKQEVEEPVTPSTVKPKLQKKEERFKKR